MRSQAAIALLLVAVPAALATACGGGSNGNSSDSEAAGVARAYVEAYNRKDGEAMCAAFTDELRRWFEHAPLTGREGLKCPVAAAGFIGYGEESDTPTFERLEVSSVDAQVSDGTARVSVEERLHYDAYPKPITRDLSDRIYLLERDGRWQVAKPGGVWFATRSAYSPPGSILDPPIADDEAHMPAPQPAATFECDPKAAFVIGDPAGDAPASLDVRRVRGSVNADGSVCVTFTFAAPPRPGTELELEIEQPEPGSSNGSVSITEPSVRIGSQGRLSFTLGRADASEAARSLEAGWRDGKLELLWHAEKGQLDGHHPFTVSGSTRTLQAWEPLVQNPLPGSGDDPFEGLGDRFEAAG